MTDETTTPPEEKITETAVSPEVTKTPAKSLEPVEQVETTESTGKRRESANGQRTDRKPGRRGQRDNKMREPKEFEEAILEIARVTRVVKGGRRLRFRVSVVIGDQKGRVGFGIGKATEVMVGIQKAVAKAKKSLINVPIFNGTIPHEINESFKSSRVLLFPAPEGKGIIAGGAVRRILELAGLKDILSKIHGSRNKLNVARATISALTKLQNKPPHGFKSKEEEKKEEITTPKEEVTKTKVEKVETKKVEAPEKKKATLKKSSKN